MRKKVSTIIGYSIILISCCSCTFVINTTKYEPKLMDYAIGDTIKPFKAFNLDEGRYCAYLIIDRSDYKDLPSGFPRKNCLMTKDINVIKEMQKSWVFIYRATDIATVTSSIYVFKDGDLIFSSGIILDEYKQGLQSPEFGSVQSLQPHKILEVCRHFVPVNWPIVIL